MISHFRHPLDHRVEIKSGIENSLPKIRRTRRLVLQNILIFSVHIVYNSKIKKQFLKFYVENSVSHGFVRKFRIEMFKTYFCIISKIKCTNLKGLGFLFQDECFDLLVSDYFYDRLRPNIRNYQTNYPKTHHLNE